MARQDKRRGGEPFGPDVWGLVTHLREQAHQASAAQRTLNKTGYPEAAARRRDRAQRFRANIRWVLAARRAIERAGK
jgi:hypothetical protein